MVGLSSVARNSKSHHQQTAVDFGRSLSRYAGKAGVRHETGAKAARAMHRRGHKYKCSLLHWHKMSSGAWRSHQRSPQ